MDNENITHTHTYRVILFTEIKGENLPVLIIYLDKGEKIITEQGAMSWMSDGVDMSTSAKKGLLAKMFTSESIFRNEFTATKDDQFIALSSSFPGNILSRSGHIRDPAESWPSPQVQELQRGWSHCPRPERRTG